jgi:hypothetical protein
MIPVTLLLMAIACLKNNPTLNYVGIFSMNLFFHLSVWPASWMIITEILPSAMMNIPVFIFYGLSLAFYKFFNEEMSQKSFKLFGVLFGFTAISLVFTIFN